MSRNTCQRTRRASCWRRSHWRASPGARLAYWNTLVPRSRPEEMADRITSLDVEAREMHLQGRAFFYCRFVIEEIERVTLPTEPSKGDA